MELLLKYVCGSRLYGTSVPTSDLDYMSIHKDSLEDIVLGRSHHTLVDNTNSSTRNTKDDIDSSSKELRRFIKDCLSGQAYALEAMFLPNDAIIHRSPIYDMLVENRSKIISNNITSFTGYLRGQSMKYSLKGVKLNSLQTVLQEMDKAPNYMSLVEFFELRPELLTLQFVKKYVKKLAGPKKLVIPGQDIEDGAPTEDYFDIVASSFPGSRKVHEALPSITLQIDNYGDRVKQSAKDGGIDLKAYYHGIRIAWELEEYLTEGRITLPCPRRDILLAIRNGEWDKDAVEEFINEEMLRVMALPNNLPEPDFAYWEQFVLDTYITSRK